MARPDRVRQALPLAPHVPPDYLMPATDWYAAVEGVATAFLGYHPAPVEDRGEIRYCPVIAFERFADPDGSPRLRAWLTGTVPIASDHFADSCQSYFINHYRLGLPPNGRLFVW